jgi:hypothetical protein
MMSPCSAPATTLFTRGPNLPEYKAWSQNLGHENVLTTFSSYGDVAGHRQAEIIRTLGATASEREADDRGEQPASCPP